MAESHAYHIEEGGEYLVTAVERCPKCQRERRQDERPSMWESHKSKCSEDARTCGCCGKVFGTITAARRHEAQCEPTKEEAVETVAGRPEMMQMELDQGPPKKRQASRLVLDDVVQHVEHVEHIEEAYEEEQVVDDVDQAVVVGAAEQADDGEQAEASGTTDDTPSKRSRGRPRRTSKVTSKNDLQCAACGKLFATAANARKHEMQSVCTKPANRDPHRLFVPGPTVREVRHRNGRGTPYHRRALEPEVITQDELEKRKKLLGHTKPVTNQTKFNLRRKRDTIFQFVSWQFDTESESDTIEEMWRLLLSRNPMKIINLAERDLGMVISDEGRAMVVEGIVGDVDDAQHHQQQHIIHVQTIDQDGDPHEEYE
uniref:C2H2-type domain-containing protein n=1 Tax=Plectus sambesii TaxID=2011161 RepID=A0A914ULZ3_9BILA